MQILRWLEGLRTPFFDKFFSLATQLGELTVFLVAAVVVLWCIDKKWGYRIAFAGLAGSAVNQSLKAIFRIPRPWLLDPSFSIVEEARAAATGYSFPSGHTQTVFALFGSVAVWRKKWWVTALCALAIALTAFSRMYLGVHTPLDVGVSLITGALTVLALALMSKRSDGGAQRSMTILMFVLCAFAIGIQLFTNLCLPKNEMSIAEFDASGIKNAYTVLGALIGLGVSWVLDKRYIKYDTHAIWWAQILKVALGLGITLLVKSALKEPLYAIFAGNACADAVRYFVVALFMGFIWPCTFKYFSRLGVSRHEKAVPAQTD